MNVFIVSHSSVLPSGFINTFFVKILSRSVLFFYFSNEWSVLECMGTGLNECIVFQGTVSSVSLANPN